MAAWKKKFEKWKNAKAPVDVDEVESLLYRIFGDRIREPKGTSHRWVIDAPELVGEPGFDVREIGVPVRNGQKVLAFYLQRAYDAAELLNLYPPKDEDDNDTDEQDD